MEQAHVSFARCVGEFVREDGGQGVEGRLG